MNEKIRKIKIVSNNNKKYDKYIKPQWTWKTYSSIVILILTLVFISYDLEIDYIELFTNSSGYFVDILVRMLPPDFSSFSNLMIAMLETIEIAFLGCGKVFIIIPCHSNICKRTGTFLVNSIKEYERFLKSQLFESLNIPKKTPIIVANIIPIIATRHVFNNPTIAALKCVLSFEYSMSVKLIS